MIYVKQLSCAFLIASMMFHATVFGAAVSSTSRLPEAAALAALARENSDLKRDLIKETMFLYPSVDRICDLVARGADVNTNTKREAGSTPLRIACSAGRLDAVLLLFSHGAKIGLQGEHTIVSTTRSAAIVELLLEKYGQNPNAILRNNASELIWATQMGHTYEKIRLLLQYGAEINGPKKVFGIPVTHHALHCFVESSYETLKDYYMGHSFAYLSSTGQLKQTAHDVLPTVALLLCNGAVVTPDILERIQRDIEASLEDRAYDPIDRTPGKRKKRVLVRNKLLEMQKMLLEAHKKPYAIVKKTLRQVDLTACATRHIAMSQELTKYDGDTKPATKYSIDPRAVEHKSSASIFSQLMRRQAGQRRLATSVSPALAARLNIMGLPKGSDLESEQDTRELGLALERMGVSREAFSELSIPQQVFLAHHVAECIVADERLPQEVAKALSERAESKDEKR